MTRTFRRFTAFRPRLEQLEDRATPVLFTVTTTADSGAGSLRDAVAQANSTAGSDTINFASNLGPIVLTSAQLTLSDATTINGPSGGTQVVQRDSAGGTPNFRIFSINSTAILNNLTISNGAVVGAGEHGGGIANSGTLSLTNCTVSGNSSANDSGAIDTTAVLTLSGCTISGNSSGNRGGAMWAGGTVLTVTNTTIWGNTANGDGGGIYFASGATLTNVTVTDNRSDNNYDGVGTGGGLFRSGGTVTLRNTLIAGNFRGTTRDDAVGAVAVASVNNLIGDGTGLAGITNGTNGNQIGTGGSPIDPLLGTLGFYGGPTQIVPLLAGSPAINGGNNAFGGAADGRGAPFARTAGGTVDIGAFEVQATPIALVVSNAGDGDDGDLGAGQLTLREAVRLSHNPGADTITFAAGLGAISLTVDQLTLSDTSGATTISGPATGTQVVQRSTAGGTPNFRIFSINSGVTTFLSGLTISNGNTTDNGGGVRSFGTLTVTNTTVSANTANGSGGGVYNFGPLTVTNTTVWGNTATGGGGVYNFGALTVTNTTVSANTANGSGGGIRSFGTTTLTNVTVTGNRSDNNDDGVGTGGGLSQIGGTVTLKNTLIAGNFRGTGTTRDDANGAADGTSVNNLIGDGTGLAGITHGTNGNQIGTGAAPINPLLGPLADNGGPTLTHALLFNSPALNAGQFAGGTLQVDQRGVTRDPIPDVGAVETQNPLTPVGVPTTRTDLYGPHPNASQNEAFVKSLYRALLGRDGDPGGVAAWVSALNSNPAVRPTVVRDFYNSPENRGNQVTFLYRYFLNRAPDSGGFNFWVGLLRTGTDEGVIVRDFLNSAEFTGSANNATFVNTMYYSLLGRASDPGGFAGWVAALDAGVSRLVVTPVFMRSPESVDRVVTSFFGSYLRRLPTELELMFIRNQVAPNPSDPSVFSMTFGQAAILVLSTNEYFNNALPEVP